MRNPFFHTLGFFVVAGSVLAGSTWAQTQPGQESQAAPSSTASPSATGDSTKDNAGGSSPKKVYTNDDLKGMHDDDISVIGNSGQQKKTPNSTAKNGQRDQAYWHNQAQKLRNQIADVDRQIAQFTASNPQNAAGEGPVNTTNGTNATYIGSQGNRLRNLQARKAALEKQLDELEEQARKAGVPPGWMR
jgi:hypothetical protein